MKGSPFFPHEADFASPPTTKGRVQEEGSALIGRECSCRVPPHPPAPSPGLLSKGSALRLPGDVLTKDGKVRRHPAA